MLDKPCSIELLQAIREGSVEAFNELYQQYVPLVMHIALKIVNDRMEAEEVCHDVFLEVLRKCHNYDSSRGSLDAWIAIIARSRSKDYVRKKRRRDQVTIIEQHAELQELRIEAVTPEAVAMTRLDQELLREALAELPTSQQKAIYAAYFKEKTHQEIATDWRVPLGTVKSWLRYGIGNLRKQLVKKGWYTVNGRGDAYDQRQ